MAKVHLFDSDHFLKFQKDNPDRFKATKCGYVRDNVTTNHHIVTCKLCLREIEKQR